MACTMIYFRGDIQAGQQPRLQQQAPLMAAGIEAASQGGGAKECSIVAAVLDTSLPIERWRARLSSLVG